MQAYRWLHSYRDKAGGDLTYVWEDVTTQDPDHFREVGGQPIWSRRFEDGSVAEVLQGVDAYPIIRVHSPKHGYDWTVDTATSMASSSQGQFPIRFGTDLPAPDEKFHPSQDLAEVGHALPTLAGSGFDLPNLGVALRAVMPDSPDPTRIPLIPRSTAEAAAIRAAAEGQDVLQIHSSAGAALRAAYGIPQDTALDAYGTPVDTTPREPRLPDLDEEGYARSLRGSKAWRTVMDVDGASRNTTLPTDEGIERGDTESYWIMPDGSSIRYKHDKITQTNPYPRVKEFTVSVPHLAVRPGRTVEGERGSVNQVEPHTFRREHIFDDQNVLIGSRNHLSANDPSGTTHTESRVHITGTQGGLVETTPEILRRRANQEISATYQRIEGVEDAVNSRRRAQQRADAATTIAKHGSPFMVSDQIARFGDDVAAGAAAHGAQQGPLKTQMELMADWVQTHAKHHPGIAGAKFSPTPSEMEDPQFVEAAWKTIRGVLYNSWKRRAKGERLEPHQQDQAEAWEDILNAPVDSPLNRFTAMNRLPRSAWSVGLMNGLTAKVRGKEAEPDLPDQPKRPSTGRRALPSDIGEFEVLQATATAHHAVPGEGGLEHFDTTVDTDHFHGASSVQDLQERMKTLYLQNPESTKGAKRRPRRAVIKVRENGEEKYITLNAQSDSVLVSDTPPKKSRHHGGQKLRFAVYTPSKDTWKTMEGTTPWSTQLVLSMKERADLEGRSPTIEDLSPNHPARDPDMPFNSGILADRDVPKLFNSVVEATRHVRETHPDQTHVIFPVHGETSDISTRGEPVAQDDPVVSKRAHVTVVHSDGSESRMGWYKSHHREAVLALQRHSEAKDIHDLVHSGPALGPQLRAWVLLNNDGASSSNRPATNEQVSSQMQRVRRGATSRPTFTPRDVVT